MKIYSKNKQVSSRANKGNIHMSEYQFSLILVLIFVYQVEILIDAKKKKMPSEGIEPSASSLLDWRIYH